MSSKTISACGVLAIAILFLAPITSNAQCDCDFVVSLSAAEWQFDGAVHKVKPGDKICFAGGTRSGIRFMNIHGTEDEPVVITNMCNSSVTIDAPPNYGSAIEIDNSSHFRFTGSGNPDKEYGIEITGAVMGLNIKSLSTDFEVDHINVHDTGCVGIVAKTDPTCDPKTWRGNYTMRNTYFHDNLVSNTGCEGFYIGNSHYETGVTKNCDGSNIRIQEHDVVNVKVYNNKLTNIGNDGIQIGGAIAGCEVYYNTIEGFGVLNNPYHVNGFQAGSGTHQAKVYGNVVSNGNGYCFWDQGGGGTYFNNIARDGLMGGFSLQDVAGTYAPTGFLVANNTIMNCGVFGIMNYSENPSQSRIVNNIIVSGLPNYPYVKYNSSTVRSRTVESNNLEASTMAEIKFQDAGQRDYRLKTGSPAIDGGIDLGQWVATDIDGVRRPKGNAFDIGAHEYAGAVSKPVANAGPDKTVMLPTGSVTLSGGAIVDNATISSYSWKQTAGSQTTLSGANTRELKVSGLVKGTYTFSLTVVDGNGSSDTDEVTVMVKESTAIANAGPNRTITLPINSISLTGSGSSSEGNIVSYHWTKTSGGPATLTNTSSSTVHVSGLVAGKYIFELTVKDQHGATASDRLLLIVNPDEDVSLSANAGPNIIVSKPASTIVISGNGKSPNGIASYKWTKVSGGGIVMANANTATLTVSRFNPGTYIFMLTIKDKAGLIVTDKMLLRVEESAFTLPDTDYLISKFNFSNEVQNVEGWVDLAGSPHVEVISAIDPSTSFKVSSVSTSQWPAVDYGFLTSSFDGGVKDGTVQDPDIVETNWFNYNAPFGSRVNGVLQGDNIMVSNLDPTHRYTLRMGASRVTGGGTADQYGTFEYRVNRTDPKTLLVTNNASRQVEYTDVKPNAAGQIGISARKIDGSAMNFGYIGWLVIEDQTIASTARMALASHSDFNDFAEMLQPTQEEEEFVFMGRHYPSGHYYEVAIFEHDGNSVFQGPWENASYDETIRPGRLYLYQVWQNGRRIDSGKIFRSQ